MDIGLVLTGNFVNSWVDRPWLVDLNNKDLIMLDKGNFTTGRASVEFKTKRLFRKILLQNWRRPISALPDALYGRRQFIKNQTETGETKAYISWRWWGFHLQTATLSSQKILAVQWNSKNIGSFNRNNTLVNLTILLAFKVSGTHQANTRQSRRTVAYGFYGAIDNNTEGV